MDAKKKFKLKRQYKTLMWVGYTCVLLFFIFLVTTLIIRKHSDADWSRPVIMIPLMVTWFLPLFGGMICLMYTGFSRQQLLTYRRDIQVYRARKFAMKTVQHLQDGELQLAINEYTKCDWYPEKSLDDYVYGMLIMACQLSKDEHLHIKGQARIKGIKDRFDPAKITF